MGNVKKRPDGKWRARYRDQSGKEHARHFSRKVDADRWLSTVESDLLRGTYVDPRAGRVTFKEYAERWRVGQVHRRTTRAQVETHLRKNAYPTFGDRPIASVLPSDVQAWVNLLANGGPGRPALAGSTVKVVYRYVSAVFRAAVRDRLITASPCIGISLPKIRRARVEPITTEAVRALAAAMPERYAALVILGAGSGERQGEAFGLEVEHVDFLRRTLRVCQQLVLMPNEEPYIGPLKTEASYRTIPLPQVVVEALAAHIAAFPPGDVKMVDVTRGPEPVTRTARLVFTDEGGRALRRTSFSRLAWVEARSRAGLPASVTFHDYADPRVMPTLAADRLACLGS